MNSRRAVVVIAALGLVHTSLRILASVLGAPWGFFNYLHPFRVRAFDAWVFAEIAGVLAALAGSLVLIGTIWRKPARRPALWSSALGAAGSGVCLGVLSVYASTLVENSYGWVLFILVPFLVGLQATLVLGYSQPVTLREAVVVSTAAVLLLGAALLAVAIEGAICLVMAVPVAVPLAMLGGAAGYALRHSGADRSPVTFILLAGLVPYGATVEHLIERPADTYMVATSVDIPAPPQRVWQAVLQRAHLGAPSNMLFRAGVAYPLASHIEGSGPTATRYCDFSTGKLVEPVLLWDEGQRLRFRVASNPLPMQEWTPYSRLHPPHLDGFLVSRQGEFLLEPLTNGATRLTATTWYQDHLYPEQYWKLWSDYIIHQVHHMVLENVRQRALAN